MNRCGTCETPTPDGIHLCPPHLQNLEYQLAEIPDLWEDFQTTLSRQDVQPSNGGGGKAGSTPPANLDAMDKAQQLRVVLRGWANTLPHQAPMGDPPRLAAHLLTHMATIVKQDWAAVLLQELTDATRDCRKATDRAANRVFAGMCPNDNTAVFTTPGRIMARCRTCSEEWDVTEWRVRALHYAGTTEGTPAELSRALSDPITGEALPAGTIRQWVNRGRLTPIGTNTLGRPVYQLRKVRNLWKRAPRRDTLQQTG